MSSVMPGGPQRAARSRFRLVVCAGVKQHGQVAQLLWRKFRCGINDALDSLLRRNETRLTAAFLSGGQVIVGIPFAPGLDGHAISLSARARTRPFKGKVSPIWLKVATTRRAVPLFSPMARRYRPPPAFGAP